MSEILEFALDYLHRRWPVIPASGKQPVVVWSSFQRELPTVSQLRKWFTGRSQRHNLAIVTGAYAGLVVVDCDSDRDMIWWQSNFPQTQLVVRTGGGGKHYYYRHPGEEVRSRSRLLDRRIDLRADGGVVIAPPSIHPQTGQPYQWDQGYPGEIDDIPAFDLCWFADCEPKGGAVGRTQSFQADATIRDGLAYIRRIKAVSGCGGHNTTFRAACKLRDSGLTPAQALQALVLWNETNASPRWSVKELAHKVDDAYRQ